MTTTSETAGWALVAIKRWWIPEWLFTLVVYACRFVESDLAEFPRLRRLMLTERFHYHDLGRPVYGLRCKRCKEGSQ